MGILDVPGISRAQADFRYATGAFAPLYGYYASLARARLARCDILALGDSIMEGQGAATVPDRWINKSQDDLRLRWMTGAGGPGFVPAVYAAGPNATKFPSWAYSSTPPALPQGLGYKAARINDTVTATITRKCTSFKLFFYRLAADVVTVSVDGGAPVTFTMNTSIREQAYSISGLASGDHTIVITGTGAGTSFCGSVFYDGDETAGVSIWDASHSGATMKLYAETYTNWVEHLQFVTPKLLLMGCLTNDCRASSNGYSSALYKGYAQSIITQARVKVPSLPVLFIPPYRPIDTETLIEPWDNYIGKLHELAAENAHCAVYDMSLRIPNVTTDTYGFRADSVHPSSVGMAYMSALATAALTPK
ncbi:SGNH/GDSL hydrolase family protein [Rhodococcus sp. USK13]|uniref:SGNH/GDSL hydrolase family protein n=1 Tax=Rhodococcus sp. USK13 TaxID=2806442 RepID=UPI001BD07699|nr:SGNH/GDSL hydrolase family protein [Rhodococcus sp. USK13]